MTTDTAATMQSLYRRFGEIPGIQIELHRSLLAVQVQNAAATATVFLQGAQLSHYRRHGEPPVIWCSPQCDYTEGTPLRGGIPICWPWFGALDRNPDPVREQLAGTAGAHGLVRHRPWALIDVQPLDDRLTRLVLALHLAAGEEPAWPAATALTLTLDIGDTLCVSLNVDNRSDDTVCFSSALHSYFAVSRIDRVSVDGLHGLDYIDCLRDWSTRRQQGPLIVDAEVDRIYFGTEHPITLVDTGWQRVLSVESSGSDSAVIWNPWTEKSRRLSQFADDAYRDMLCIETANAATDFIRLPPSQQHELSVTVRCRPLS